jgi:hypothetical protein
LPGKGVPVGTFDWEYVDVAEDVLVRIDVAELVANIGAELAPVLLWADTAPNKHKSVVREAMEQDIVRKVAACQHTQDPDDTNITFEK